jgi:hypothetical protein
MSSEMMRHQITYFRVLEESMRNSPLYEPELVRLIGSDLVDIRRERGEPRIEPGFWGMAWDVFKTLLCAPCSIGNMSRRPGDLF